MNEVVPITSAAAPGGWNDLDMLEVGNAGLTIPEQQTHFAFWAAAKSPLVISTDLNAISDEALAILTNERIIALNVSGVPSQEDLRVNFSGHLARPFG
jgi:alpha-galactosidase